MQKMKTAWISIQLDRQLRNLKGRALQRSRGGGGGGVEADGSDAPKAGGLLGDVANLQNEHTDLVDEIDETIQVRCSVPHWAQAAYWSPNKTTSRIRSHGSLLAPTFPSSECGECCRFLHSRA
jgi:hypothetical protein